MVSFSRGSFVLQETHKVTRLKIVLCCETGVEKGLYVAQRYGGGKIYII